MNKPQVHVVIINWNRPQDTISCIESICKSTYDRYKIILCDNGSSGDSLESIEKWLIEEKRSYSAYNCAINYSCNDVDTQSRVSERFDFSLLRQSENIEIDNTISIIRVDENLGFTGGCNIAIDYALKDSTEYVMLINNDAVIKSDCIENSVRVAQEGNAKIVGSIIWDSTGDKILFDYLKFPIHLFVSVSFGGLTSAEKSGEYWATDSTNGAGMLIDRSFLERRLGEYGFVFDESFFMYCEEFDLCLYAKSIGAKVLMSRDSIVFHNAGSSSGGVSSYLSCYYENRNRMYLASSWLSLFQLIIFHMFYAPSRVIIQIRRLIRSRRITDLPNIRGLLDGYLGIKGKVNLPF